MNKFRHSKPRILVTGPDRGGILAWWFTWLAIRRAGGRPKHVTPARYRAAIDFEGLIIGGGADISPDLYGQKYSLPKPKRDKSFFSWLLALLLYPLLFMVRLLFSIKHYQGLDRKRDRLEYDLLQQAVQFRKPVLGICRGAQLINVYLTGTLHQDISGFYTESPQVWSIQPKKMIHIAPDSRLGALLATEVCMVNGLHNQSIDRLGRGLRVSARETNSIVQAIEITSKCYLIGVQWHPEYLPHHKRQQRLFQGLVEAAANGGGQ